MNWSCCHHLGFNPPLLFHFFHFSSKEGKKKSIFPRPFASKICCFLCPESLFSAGCTRPSDALLRYSIVDVLNNTNKKKKESKKGPRKREREREFGRIVRRPSSSSSSLYIITREEEEEHIFEFAVKNLWVPPSVASTPDEARKSILVQKSS